MLDPHCVVEGGREEEEGDRDAGDVHAVGPGGEGVAEVHVWCGLGLFAWEAGRGGREEGRVGEDMAWVRVTSVPDKGNNGKEGKGSTADNNHGIR